MGGFNGVKWAYIQIDPRALSPIFHHERIRARKTRRHFLDRTLLRSGFRFRDHASHAARGARPRDYGFSAGAVGAGANLVDVRGLCLADEQCPRDLADAPGGDRRDGGVSHDGDGDSGGVRRRRPDVRAFVSLAMQFTWRFMCGNSVSSCYNPPMGSKLSTANPYLRDPAVRQGSVYQSVASSSAIEGIRAPFRKTRVAKRASG